MKTITIIIASVLALNVNLLSASTLNPSNPISKATVLSFLAPIVPMEASFEESDITLDYTALLPEYPAEATFEETEATTDYKSLTPVVPMIADFE